MIGKSISHFRILEKLGQGGMGVVYKAQDTKLDRFVALKFLPHHIDVGDEEKKRFIQEAKAASALDHPNICTIHEINETDNGQMFITMACYEGESLKDKIDRGPLPFDEAINIAVQIAEGLRKAHSKNIIHRDIKPANILITEDEQIKIVDFGLAKLAGRSLLSDLKNLGSKNFDADSFGVIQSSKKSIPRWLVFTFGILVLLIASILYFLNPFGAKSNHIKSLVVLPFENLTGDTELEYFVSGMHASLIGEISKISALRVISKTTSNTYKNVEKSIANIASELGVEAAIEASVLSLGDSVLIQVKLVGDFPDEKQLWLRDYMESKSQILNLYNLVTKEISQ